ncbi:NADH-ubiquinone oxidoreductase chain L [Serinicoccus hydrothermalis]|uniref:NADH-ubiquinone oxidoreductase chain L n=1 Tax=Serinicoccus hydrothermalis TaxID=1758689 RepID=A0A1B1NFJ9_9MICO|nr:NADH-quinone oxidoreductase subunit L [Serinicoccus hydrothermalis]ANS80189.1 NADH-ubiquinone oxidoreductase chain L [Serinicoccus hydrothermalis]
MHDLSQGLAAVSLTLADDPGGLGATHATQADGIAGLGWLLVALPLAGAALLLLGGRVTNSWGPALATGLSWASFGVGVAIIAQLAGLPEAERALSVPLWEWVSVGDLSLRAGLLLDPLSLAFVMLITFVGSLIHVYSLGYMEHDPDKRRFFAYLNLFVAAMLILVLADSYLLLFVGWEGVGLASYLLIGFWNWNPDYAAAANKAFVVNRVGDVGLITAMAIMLATFGALDFATVHGSAGGASDLTLTLVGLALLLAACGKSAQFPLQSWLGDAMAGPTPVSALIHAATMVTAGVYLIARSQAIYDLTPDARLVVAVVGAVTLLYGAIVGCAKDDLKKALAASTMSQIGYMMLAVGLGPVGYLYAIFHLVTHGFFKANMFLGAGSVMHAMNNRVDMRRFGALRKDVKITFITFAAGWLAIIGFPLTAGWFSKDYIIETAFTMEGWQGWVFGGVALLGAGITAFYMSRLFFMTFFGEKRWHEDDHPHESPLVMTVPMMVLALGSLVLGAVLYPTGIITGWLEPVFGHAEHGEPLIPQLAIQISAFVLMLAGAGLAWMMYARREVPQTAPRASLVTVAARRDLFQDDVNDALFTGPTMALARTTVDADDVLVEGGVTGGTTGGLNAVSGLLRRAQNGFVRSYALTMLLGVVAILGAVWVMQ